MLSHEVYASAGEALLILHMYWHAVENLELTVTVSYRGRMFHDPDRRFGPVIARVIANLTTLIITKSCITTMRVLIFSP